ncbi:hypothetical protein C8R43DRAFT_125724 [Mycena crocata]|nr:hypothetical protein C8R43DRAFT_125724 [Mycena crocata]
MRVCIGMSGDARLGGVRASPRAGGLLPAALGRYARKESRDGTPPSPHAHLRIASAPAASATVPASLSVPSSLPTATASVSVPAPKPFPRVISSSSCTPKTKTKLRSTWLFPHHCIRFCANAVEVVGRGMPSVPARPARTPLTSRFLHFRDRLRTATHHTHSAFIHTSVPTSVPQYFLRTSALIRHIPASLTHRTAHSHTRIPTHSSHSLRALTHLNHSSLEFGPPDFAVYAGHPRVTRE